MTLRLSACLLLIAALAACNKSEPAAATATTAPAAPPATSAVPAAPSAQAGADASIALDMDKVRSYAQAGRNLALAVEADSSIGDPAQDASEENSTQYAARLEASPKMRAAIAQAGLSTRDFARIGDTLTGAMMTQGALEAGQLKQIPDGIDPASVEFVKQHKAEIDKLMAAMSGAG